MFHILVHATGQDELALRCSHWRPAGRHHDPVLRTWESSFPAGDEAAARYKLARVLRLFADQLERD